MQLFMLLVISHQQPTSWTLASTGLDPILLLARLILERLLDPSGHELHRRFPVIRIFRKAWSLDLDGVGFNLLRIIVDRVTSEFVIIHQMGHGDGGRFLNMIALNSGFRNR